VIAAYILIQTEVGKAAQVAKDIVEIKGVQQAEDVTGPYDVIVRVQVVDGITRTLTCPVVRL
jgi:DNA-binding Lrp family transcriptional regulator